MILLSMSVLRIPKLLDETKKSVCMTELRSLQEAYILALHESTKSFEEILISSGAQCPSGEYYSLLDDQLVLCSIHSENEVEEIPYLKR